MSLNHIKSFDGVADSHAITHDINPKTMDLEATKTILNIAKQVRSHLPHQINALAKLLVSTDLSMGNMTDHDFQLIGIIILEKTETLIEAGAWVERCSDQIASSNEHTRG